MTEIFFIDEVEGVLQYETGPPFDIAEQGGLEALKAEEIVSAVRSGSYDDVRFFK